MLINGEDLIYKVSEKEEVIRKVSEKYKSLFGDYSFDEDMLDFRSEEEIEECVRTDADNIRSAARTILSGDEKVNVRHCYDPEGRGYFAITTGTKRRFVPSCFSLQCAGGCSSLRVWLRLFSADALMYVYLCRIKAYLGADVDMQIRHLYLKYVEYAGYVRAIEEKDNAHPIELGEISIIKTTRQEYREAHLAEYEECEKAGLDNIHWYNGEGNDIYYFIYQATHEAVLKIYKHEDELKACGLWEDARRAIDIMDDIVYKRGAFISKPSGNN